MAAFSLYRRSGDMEILDGLVNQRSLQVDPAAKTWVDLLRTLDRGLNPDARIVTVGRFEGVDGPSCRESNVGASE